MNYIIRKIKETEYHLLDDFLYEAIFVPEGMEAPLKEVIYLPELQVYVADFGKEKDDICFVAEADEKIVGAVWVRDMKDYGHIEDGVPSFAVSLYKQYRGYGIGTELMKKMLCELKERGYEKTSLSVQKANYAVSMYQKVGFEIIDENEEEYIMVCHLNPDKSVLKIRTANMDEYYSVRDFYYSLIDAMEDAEFKPGWQKDVYPTQEFLIKSIKNDELYIGKLDEKIVSCMVVNQEYNEGYNHITWSVQALDSELLVIHALGVHPAFSGQGIAKQMVQKVIDTARENHLKTIRLDVLGGNLPAEKAYTKMGFQYLDTIQMFYEDTGWTEYKIYEFII